MVPDSFAFSPTWFAQGVTVEVSAMIKNAGSIVQSKIPVAFYYGVPGNGGVEIGTRPVISGPLAPGDRAAVTAYWQIPDPAVLTA